MSWSINVIGTPDKITEALDVMSESLTGDSKAEFDNALPHLKGLVGMNYNEAIPGMGIELSASGHAHGAEGNGYSNCLVSIKPLNAALLT